MQEGQKLSATKENTGINKNTLSKHKGKQSQKKINETNKNCVDVGL
jgi:hypothetical protein